MTNEIDIFSITPGLTCVEFEGEEWIIVKRVIDNLYLATKRITKLPAQVFLIHATPGSEIPG